MAESAASGSRRAREEGYEPSDLRIGGVLLVVGGSLAVLALTGLALWGMVLWFAAESERPSVTSVERARIETPPPLLQSAPKTDLAEFRAHEEAMLQSWHWVDQTAGVAQIPIERAMQLLVERGWPQPDRPASPVPTPRSGETEPPRAPLPSSIPRAPPQMSPLETGPTQARPQGGVQ
jgi:hypothetical protein